MKVKMFFLIFLMNVTSYLGRGECNCCECLENCWNGKKEANNMVPKVNEMNVDNEKKNSEIKNKSPRDFVKEIWLEKKEKQKNFVLRLFDKTTVENEYKSKDGGITIKLKKDGDKTVIENSDKVKEELKTDIGKWALFEIKIVDNETYYLYCSDIESEKGDPLEIGIFEGKEVFLSISVLACDTIKVKSMYHMFSFCYNLKTLDLSKFNTSSVTNMGYMFDCCYELQTLDLSSFDTSNVQKMFGMFRDCFALQTLDLSNFFLKNNINLSSDVINESLDTFFLDNTHALKFIYFKNKQVANSLLAYCKRFIYLDNKYAVKTRVYEYYYDQEKIFHCVKITKKKTDITY